MSIHITPTIIFSSYLGLWYNHRLTSFDNNSASVNNHLISKDVMSVHGEY